MKTKFMKDPYWDVLSSRGIASDSRRSRMRFRLLVAGRHVCLLGLVFLGACHGCVSNHDEVSTPEPVVECKQYEATLNNCQHTNLSVANHPSLMPKSDEDRQRIKEFCSDNLKRIRVACGLTRSLALAASSHVGASPAPSQSLPGSSQ